MDPSSNAHKQPEISAPGSPVKEKIIEQEEDHLPSDNEQEDKETSDDEQEDNQIRARKFDEELAAPLDSDQIEDHLPEELHLPDEVTSFCSDSDYHHAGTVVPKHGKKQSIPPVTKKIKSAVDYLGNADLKHNPCSRSGLARAARGNLRFSQTSLG